jgi:hypothetical protein
MNRDYSKIKVSVWREKGGHLVTELTTVSGKFVMMYGHLGYRMKLRMWFRRHCGV